MNPIKLLSVADKIQWLRSKGWLRKPALDGNGSSEFVYGCDLESNRLPLECAVDCELESGRLREEKNGDGQTHSELCWMWHHECAVEQIKRFKNNTKKSKSAQKQFTK